VSTQNQKIILFDGVCNLCNGSVQFIIKHDKHGVFIFAPLQSESSQSLLEKLSSTHPGLDTVILVDDENIYTESEAIVRIARELSGPWRIISWGKVMPGFLRNGLYRLVSKYRYAIFGRSDSCMVPTEELLSRFIQP